MRSAREKVLGRTADGGFRPHRHLAPAAAQSMRSDSPRRPGWMVLIEAMKTKTGEDQ